VNRALLVTACLAVAVIASQASGQYVDPTPDRPGESAPFREGDTDSVPLNKEDPTFNLWQTLRDDLGKGREPGPINIQKFPGGFGFQGIPTFFRLPVALTPEDLAAGKVDVLIMGEYTDNGGGMRGAAFGPNAVRNSNRYLPWGVFTGPHGHVMVDPFQELTIVDYGDAPIEPFSGERSVAAIRSHLRDALAVEVEPGRRVVPILVGGDHSLLYANAAALADTYGKESFSVVHFDAHQDGSRAFLGHMYGHGQPIWALMREKHLRGDQFIQVGLRGFRPDAEDLAWMREEGFRYHHMAEIERRGFEAVMNDVLREAKKSDKIYISVDIDVLDPAYVVGTGTPEPGGLTPRELFPIVRRLCAETNTIGFELVELSPLIDPTYVSAQVAHRIIRECLTGLAMHKKGIKEPHYLSPLTVDDGR
jgi:agmatinase